jgi:hypothetical protein
MKLTTIYSGGNRIDIFNSFLGKETIKVNDEIVSSKYSFLGTEHHFKLTENSEEVECLIVTGFGQQGIALDFYKNGKPIIETPKNGCLVFFSIVFVVIITIDVLDRIFG